MDLRIVSMNGGDHIKMICKELKKPVGMHLHDYYEMEMVLEGFGEQNLNGTIYQMGPGTIYFLTPIDFHAVTPKGSMKIVNLSFDETLLSSQLRLMFMNRRENYIFSAESEPNRTLQAVLELLQAESERDDEHTYICRRDLLEVLLYTAARGKGRDNVVTNQVHKSMQYLFRHFREDISLEEVARQSGYTPNYFSTLFHESTGEKFVDFLGNLRLNYAKMLLQSTDLSITEVAEKAGFGSASAMHRKFQKTMGMPPSKFKFIARFDDCTV